MQKVGFGGGGGVPNYYTIIQGNILGVFNIRRGGGVVNIRGMGSNWELWRGKLKTTAWLLDS